MSQKATLGYPPMAVQFVGGVAASRRFTFNAGVKWTAAFPLPDLDLVEGMNLDNDFILFLHHKEEEG